MEFAAALDDYRGFVQRKLQALQMKVGLVVLCVGVDMGQCMSVQSLSCYLCFFLSFCNEQLCSAAYKL